MGDNAVAAHPRRKGRTDCEWPSPSALANRLTLDIFWSRLSVRVFVHPDQVALHGATAILQHSAQLLTVVQDKKIDV